MMVTDGTLLKIYAWYDNEVGYACRMVDLADIVIRGSLACPSVRSPVSCWRSGRGLDEPEPPRRRRPTRGAPSRLPRQEHAGARQLLAQLTETATLAVYNPAVRDDQRGLGFYDEPDRDAAIETLRRA